MAKSLCRDAHDRQHRIEREVWERALAGHAALDDLRYQDVERARALASDDINRRLDGMNQIREQLNSQARTFMPIATYDAKNESLIARIDQNQTVIDGRLKVIENKNSNLEGRMFMLGAGVTIVNIALGILGLYLRK